MKFLNDIKVQAKNIYCFFFLMTYSKVTEMESINQWKKLLQSLWLLFSFQPFDTIFHIHLACGLSALISNSHNLCRTTFVQILYHNTLKNLIWFNLKLAKILETKNIILNLRSWKNEIVFLSLCYKELHMCIKIFTKSF